MSITEELVNSLLEELNCETVFTIPLFGGIEISEAVVVTWIIMAVLVLLSVCLVRNLKVENPGKKQLLLETGVSFLYDFFEETMGEKGRRYIPYLSTVVIYIGISNIIGLFGFKPPTKALNVTAALAIMSIVLIEYSGIHAKGVKKWVKSFAEPVAIVAPINVLELFIRPLSLCMRLFGNVLGAFVVMELIKLVVPLVVPVAFSCYFDIFDGFIQAYVFVFLTSLFIKEAVEYMPIVGVTSNPSIVKKTSPKDFFKHMKEVRKIIGKERSLHIQVISKECDEIVKEAHRILEEIDDQVYIKVPVSYEGVKAIKQLKSEGINVTATAVYDLMQAYMALAAGADYIAPYVNRIGNLGNDPMELINELSNRIVQDGYDCKILAASFKGVQQVRDAFNYGSQAITAPVEVLKQIFANPSIEKAVNDFNSDWYDIYGEGKGICDL